MLALFLLITYYLFFTHYFCVLYWALSYSYIFSLIFVSRGILDRNLKDFWFWSGAHAHSLIDVFDEGQILGMVEVKQRTANHILR